MSEEEDALSMSWRERRARRRRPSRWSDQDNEGNEGNERSNDDGLDGANGANGSESRRTRRRLLYTDNPDNPDPDNPDNHENVDNVNFRADNQEAAQHDDNNMFLRQQQQHQRPLVIVPLFSASSAIRQNYGGENRRRIVWRPRPRPLFNDDNQHNNDGNNSNNGNNEEGIQDTQEEHSDSDPLATSMTTSVPTRTTDDPPSQIDQQPSSRLHTFVFRRDDRISSATWLNTSSVRTSLLPPLQQREQQESLDNANERRRVRFLMSTIYMAAATSPLFDDVFDTFSTFSQDYRPRGLNAREIDENLIEAERGVYEIDDVCPICHETLSNVIIPSDDAAEGQNNQNVLSKIEKCGHVFCKCCITKWLNRARTCPVCKTEIGATLDAVEEEEEDEEEHDEHDEHDDNEAESRPLLENMNEPINEESALMQRTNNYYDTNYNTYGAEYNDDYYDDQFGIVPWFSTTDATNAIAADVAAAAVADNEDQEDQEDQEEDQEDDDAPDDDYDYALDDVTNDVIEAEIDAQIANDDDDV